MDFGQRISDAQGNVNTSKNTYNEYAQQANQAGTKFDSAFDNRQGYGDIYQNARDKYYNTDEINAARDTYQNARGAVDQLNTTINKMPESIRQQYGGTGLTEAEKMFALRIYKTNYYNEKTYEDCAHLVDRLDGIYRWQSNSEGPNIFCSKILCLLRIKKKDVEWFIAQLGRKEEAY